jgi:hypothetical protein
MYSNTLFTVNVPQYTLYTGCYKHNTRWEMIGLVYESAAYWSNIVEQMTL